MNQKPVDHNKIDPDTPPPAASPLVKAVREAFSDDAPLARSIPGFARRAGQLALAESIATAIDQNGALVAEAGTGIGKTFAYLMPALLSGRRVLISTGTKTLQDQLYSRDLPSVLAASGTGLKTALLKGRSNYVCHHHLARNLAEGRFARREDGATLHRINRFASISRTGDRAEAPGIAEDASAWAYATSSRDNCLGQDCDYIDKCFVLHARKQALQADVVVINHHLFCADLALRDDGVSELLPKADLMIFDEAHQLPETATQFFGETVSTRQFVELARDCARIGRADAPDGADWLALSGAIEQSLRECRLAAGRVRRIDEAELVAAQSAPLLRSWHDLLESLAPLIEVLETNAERSRDLEKLSVRGQALNYAVSAWLAVVEGQQPPERPVLEGDEPLAIASLVGAESQDAELTDADAPDTDAERALSDRPSDSSHQFSENCEADVEQSAHDDPAIHWIDVHKQGLSLHRTPLSVSGPFKRQRLERPASWIFTSATLSVGNRFNHFVQALGLDDATCERHDSPFDFATQALLYVPDQLPDPRQEAFAPALADAVAPLIEANEGRAFVLCTSLRMVDAMAALLADRLHSPIAKASGYAAPSTALRPSAWDEPAGSGEASENKEAPFTLLVQGTDTRDVLLTRFREAGRPVLIGSASFWEGVDVVGAQLSLVVIDKLPFAPPDDPVVAARARQMRQRGEEPFMQLHLPRAAMSLKQGAGRLIRSEKDRGLLVIGDTRLAEKAYGRRLLSSLPPFKRTRSASEALAFVTD
ncbi:MAG: ATP-dependent DNA helicase [Burkholderiaceae bacterium]